MTIMREKFVAALTARGETRVKKTSSYDIFTATSRKSASAAPCYFYIGRSGALRIGESLKKSIPCSSQFKQTLLKEGGEKS